MHEHKHSCCDHCLHYCPHCDRVYCCKCNKEWGNDLNYCSFGTWYFPTPYTETCGGTGSTYPISSSNLTTCTHEHTEGGEK